MQVIYKFPLELIRKQEIKLPNVHRILHVGHQNGELMMWVMLYKEHAYDSSVTIHVYGTGHEIPDADILHHLQTVQDGVFVWHVFLELGTG